MHQLGYSIIRSKTLIPASHIFPCDENPNHQDGSFILLKDWMDFPIDFENKHLEQSKATKHIVNYFKQVFKNELKNFSYEIVDVSSVDNKFTLERTNIVIAPKVQSNNNSCIGIQIKNPETIRCQKTFKQFILEFIKSVSNNNKPTLFVSTDLDTFKFLWLSDPDKKIIGLFQTRSYRYSIHLMKQFIAYHKSSVVYKPNNIKANEEETLMDTRRNKVEEAYKRCLAQNKLVKLKGSRTKSVYKIVIDEKQYVLKMANYNDKPNIYNELVIENGIYKYLSNLRK